MTEINFGAMATGKTLLFNDLQRKFVESYLKNDMERPLAIYSSYRKSEPVSTHLVTHTSSGKTNLGNLPQGSESVPGQQESPGNSVLASPGMLALGFLETDHNNDWTLIFNVGYTSMYSAIAASSPNQRRKVQSLSTREIVTRTKYGDFVWTSGH